MFKRSLFVLDPRLCLALCALTLGDGCTTSAEQHLADVAVVVPCEAWADGSRTHTYEVTWIRADQDPSCSASVICAPVDVQEVQCGTEVTATLAFGALPEDIVISVAGSGDSSGATLLSIVSAGVYSTEISPGASETLLLAQEEGVPVASCISAEEQTASPAPGDDDASATETPTPAGDDDASATETPTPAGP